MQTDDWLEALGNAYIRFWICPVDGHSDSRVDANGRPVVTVEWCGDIAHCTWPGCGRTSETDREHDADR